MCHSDFVAVGATPEHSDLLVVTTSTSQVKQGIISLCAIPGIKATKSQREKTKRLVNYSGFKSINSELLWRCGRTVTPWPLNWKLEAPSKADVILLMLKNAEWTNVRTDLAVIKIKAVIQSRNTSGALEL